MKKNMLLLLTICLISCDGGPVQNNAASERLPEDIKVPRLKDSAEPNATLSIETMNYASNQFITKGNITDQTFSIHTPLKNQEYRYDDNYTSHNDDRLEIFIDVTQFLTIDEYQIPDDFYENLPIEDLYGDGLQKKLNQYPLNRYASYPVFIINKSNTFNTIVLEDGSIAMIYEAKDENGTWQPIEFKTYSWCGNSYSEIQLQPNEFALLKVPVQSGDFATKLRLKARIGERVFYSNEIPGSIHRSQFEKEESTPSKFWSFHFEPENYASLFLDE